MASLNGRKVRTADEVSVLSDKLSLFSAVGIAGSVVLAILSQVLYRYGFLLGAAGAVMVLLGLTLKLVEGRAFAAYFRSTGE